MESHRIKQPRTLSPGNCIYAGSCRNALEHELYQNSKITIMTRATYFFHV